MTSSTGMAGLSIPRENLFTTMDSGRMTSLMATASASTPTNLSTRVFGKMEIEMESANT